jgi:hypothetical protein
MFCGQNLAGCLASGCFVSNVMNSIEKQLAETKGSPDELAEKNLSCAPRIMPIDSKIGSLFVKKTGLIQKNIK